MIHLNILRNIKKIFGSQRRKTEIKSSKSMMFHLYNEMFFLIMGFLFINSSGTNNLEDSIEKNKIYT